MAKTIEQLDAECAALRDGFYDEASEEVVKLREQRNEALAREAELAEALGNFAECASWNGQNMTCFEKCQIATAALKRWEEVPNVDEDNQR